MRTPKNRFFNLGVIIGVLGFIAGIILMFGEDWITGGFGAIASAFVAYLSYSRTPHSKEQDECCLLVAVTPHLDCRNQDTLAVNTGSGISTSHVCP